MPPTSSRRRPGIKVHTTQLAPEDSTIYQDLRITNVARTISDCTFDYIENGQIKLAIFQALQLSMTTSDELITQSQRRSRRVQQLIEYSIEEYSKREKTSLPF